MYLEKQGWKNVLLVTSNYHMKRAHYVFDRVLGEQHPEVKLYTHALAIEPSDAGEEIRVTFSEFLKGVYYRLVWR